MDLPSYVDVYIRKYVVIYVAGSSHSRTRAPKVTDRSEVNSIPIRFKFSLHFPFSIAEYALVT